MKRLCILIATLACCRAPVAVQADAPDPPPSVAKIEPAPEPIPQNLVQFHGRGEVRSETTIFAVEIARNDAERSQGLMFRRELAADKGMLFLMPGDDDWAFWMKNTLISLDMIFIDRNWRVAGVVTAEPLTLQSRRVGKNSRYVLELAAGVAAKTGIVAGSELHFSALPDVP